MSSTKYLRKFNVALFTNEDFTSYIYLPNDELLKTFGN